MAFWPLDFIKFTSSEWEAFISKVFYLLRFFAWGVIKLCAFSFSMEKEVVYLRRFRLESWALGNISGKVSFYPWDYWEIYSVSRTRFCFFLLLPNFNSRSACLLGGAYSISSKLMPLITRVYLPPAKPRSISQPLGSC